MLNPHSSLVAFFSMIIIYFLYVVVNNIMWIIICSLLLSLLLTTTYLPPILVLFLFSKLEIILLLVIGCTSSNRSSKLLLFPISIRNEMWSLQNWDNLFKSSDLSLFRHLSLERTVRCLLRFTPQDDAGAEVVPWTLPGSSTTCIFSAMWTEK